MINVRNMINKQKDKFHEYKRTQVVKDTAKLERERKQQGEMAKVNAKRQSARQDVEKLQNYNKQVEGPSKFERFGVGLTKVVNAAKEAKKAVPKKKISKGSPSRLRSINQGSGGLAFGGNSGSNSAFSFGPTPQKKKEIKKQTPIIIKINR